VHLAGGSYDVQRIVSWVARTSAAKTVDGITVYGLHHSYR
jgi:hypothetical protein